MNSQDTIPYYLHTACSMYVQEMRLHIEIAERVLYDERYGESFLQSYVRKSNWLYAHFFSRRSTGNVQMLFSMMAAHFEKSEPEVSKLCKSIIGVQTAADATKSKLFDRIGSALLSIVTTMIEKGIYPENKATLENLKRNLAHSLSTFDKLYLQFVNRKKLEQAPQEDVIEAEDTSYIGQQRAQAEEMFNQILQTLPSSVAGDLRHRARRMDTNKKLQWVLNELQQKG